jgi:hypothetical protein
MVEVIDQLNSLPFLLPGMLLTSVIVSAGIFVWGVLYWAPTATTRPKSDNFSNTGRATGGEPDYHLKLDRRLRAVGDQWLSTTTLALSAFVLFWYIIYTWLHGIHTFQPIPDGYDRFDIMHYGVIKCFEVGTVLITGFATLVVLFTMTDMFKKYATDNYHEQMTLSEGAQPAQLGVEPEYKPRATVDWDFDVLINF